MIDATRLRREETGGREVVEKSAMAVKELCSRSWSCASERSAFGKTT
jgi:hypothetical protein